MVFNVFNTGLGITEFRFFNEPHQPVATQGANTILECLSKNGYLPIKHIKVMIAELVTA